MNIGDEVELTVRRAGFAPGAKGRVEAVKGNGTINVSINEDSGGKPVSPPFPDLAAPASSYTVL